MVVVREAVCQRFFCAHNKSNRCCVSRGPGRINAASELSSWVREAVCLRFILCIGKSNRCCIPRGRLGDAVWLLSLRAGL